LEIPSGAWSNMMLPSSCKETLELSQVLFEFGTNIEDTLQKVLELYKLKHSVGPSFYLHSLLVDVVRCLSLGGFKHVKVCQLKTLFDFLKNIHKIILNKLN
jgi:hypothetical protein